MKYTKLNFYILLLIIFYLKCNRTRETVKEGIFFKTKLLSVTGEERLFEVCI